jgi:hypothetical protein
MITPSLSNYSCNPSLSLTLHQQDAETSPVCLVYLVYLVCLVYLVHPVSLAQPNKQDKPDEPDEPGLSQ